MVVIIVSNITKSRNKFKYGLFWFCFCSFHKKKLLFFLKIENEKIPLCVIHEFSVFFLLLLFSFHSIFVYFLLSSLSILQSTAKTKAEQKCFDFQRRLMMKLLAVPSICTKRFCFFFWFISLLKWKSETIYNIIITCRGQGCFKFEWNDL